MNGLPYYKRYPRDFVEGTIGMPYELKVTYSFILDLIYMQGGNLPDDPRYIAGLLGVSVRKWNSLRDGLVTTGKITVSGDYLTNYRAVSELESLSKYQSQQSENRRGANKNKDLEKRRSNHTEPEPDITIEDKSSIAETTPDPARLMFEHGIKLLIGAGKAEPAARAILGKWRKQHGEAVVIAALGKAQREGAIDPVAFCEGVFRHSKKQAASSPQMAGAFGRIPERN